MFLVLHDEGTCGHKHRKYNRAVDCLNFLEDHGKESLIVETKYNPDLLWIEKCLLVKTNKENMARILTE